MGFKPLTAKEGDFEDVIRALDSIMTKYLFMSKLSVVIDYSCIAFKGKGKRGILKPSMMGKNGEH